MTSHQRSILSVVGVVLAASWFVSAGIAGVAWSFDHPDIAAEAQRLWVIASVLCVLAFVWLGVTQAPTVYRTCHYCGEEVPETQGYPCAGGRFACDECCTHRRTRICR